MAHDIKNIKHGDSAPVQEFKKVLPGLIIAVLIGGVAFGSSTMLDYPAADSLLVALVLGIIARSVMDQQEKLTPGFTAAPAFLLPVGIVFYGGSNLNFATLKEIDTPLLVLLVIIMIVYFAVVLFLGKLLNQKREITYLTASGSAVCGASAIAVTSPAVRAEPDDISISLLSVAVAAFFGFTVIMPFLAALFDMTCKNYCMLSGSVVQFTGLVKISGQLLPFLRTEHPQEHWISLALSLKAVRYLALLVAIPLFASLIRNKFYIPWLLWAFLAAGLLGTWAAVSSPHVYRTTLVPVVKVIHLFSWSTAMAAIGLNANVRGMLSMQGSKALLMAFAGFMAAIATFFLGVKVIQLF
ncbi:MAG: putative sulfate exporter family transporter [Nitrospiraceae bacterium]|nr:MAG: putative sulfate exporter family transporter [Nitrospiraceae bacterium]